jgi:transposase InsO family protein
VITSQGYK